ncbi:hypothetical protein C8R46DRAFT_1071556, partial [Mycena filopes]
MRAGVLEEPFGGGMRESRDRGTRQGVADQNLVAHAYNYSDDPSANTSEYFAPPRSEGGTSGSAPGFAGLGAGTAGGYAAGAYDSESTGPLSPRRGLHTAGQPSTSSSLSLPHTTGAAGASLSGSSAAARAGDAARPQAGPLPRKRVPPPSARTPSAGASGATRRADSSEPFLEEEGHEPWMEVDPVPAGSERHRDGGPVSEVSLGRSASGRLPPAYGE